MNSEQTVKLLCDRLDQVSDSVTRQFAGMGFDHLNQKPTTKAWSIAEVLDHIILVNKSYFPIIDSALKGSYRQAFTARLPFLVRACGKMITKSVDPASQRKTKTLPIWEPASSDVSADIVDIFLQHQQEVKTMFRKSNSLVNSKFVISSPANRMIVYDIETAFNIIVLHEERHLEQAKRVALIVG